jgi:Tol biopolymer transport system component
MRRPRMAWQAGACGSALALLATAGAWAAMGSPELVSATPAGQPANGDSGHGEISRDGRYVAFGSAASDLTPGDTNARSDVFVRDRSSGRTQRVSHGAAGKQANGPSGGGLISANGRWVAFTSTATNLVPGDTNGLADVFLHDRRAHTTVRVSLTTAGGQVDDHAYAAAISADGRVVAFATAATNVAPGDDALCFDAGEDDDVNCSDVFVRDLRQQRTEWVSVDSQGRPSGGQSFEAALSRDGRLVAMTTSVEHDGWGGQIWLRDRQGRRTERLDSAGGDPTGSPDITPDGRYVAFVSRGANGVPGDDDTCSLDGSDLGCVDVYVLDRRSGTMQRVSDPSRGQEGQHGATDVAMLRAADGGGVFLHRRATGVVERAAVGQTGQPAYGGDPAISGDGTLVGYRSNAGVDKVFVRRVMP